MDDQSSRPRSINKALQLAYFSLVLALPRTIMQWNTTPGSSMFKLVVLVLTFGFIIFVLQKVGQQRNWARLVFLILFVLGLPTFFLSLPKVFSVSIISGVLAGIQFLCQSASTVLMFVKSSTRWFHEGRHANA